MSRSNDSPLTTYEPWVEFSWVVIGCPFGSVALGERADDTTVVETGNTWKSGAEAAPSRTNPQVRGPLVLCRTRPGGYLASLLLSNGSVDGRAAATVTK